MSTKKRWRNSPFFVFYYIYYKTFMKKNLFVINENEKERIINMHKNATKNLYNNKTYVSEQILIEQYDTKELDKLKLEILTGLNVLKTNNPMFSGKIDGHIKTLEGIQTNLICNGNKLSNEVQTKLNDAKEDLKLKSILKDPENKIDGMVSKIAFIENFCSTAGNDISSGGDIKIPVAADGQQNIDVVSVQQRINKECKADVLNTALLNFPKARIGSPPNYKLKEDGKNGSGTKSAIQACALPNLNKVLGQPNQGSQESVPPKAGSSVSKSTPVGVSLNDNDISTLMS